MWDKGWDDIFKNNEWGKYPPEELIRFIARNYYGAPDRSKVKILEIGSGTGANLWYLAREGFDVTGIDGSSVGAERARERLKLEGLKARIDVGDAVSTPYADGTFDCIIDIECIYANTYGDSRKIISEAFRILKKNGLFFSKTFMTGTYGDGRGEKVKGEEHTYKNIAEGAFRKGYEIIRFTSKEEIPGLYSPFKVKSIDYDIRSDQNSDHEVREWLIVCSKE